MPDETFSGKWETRDGEFEIGNWAGEWQPTADGHPHELAIESELN